MWGKLNTKQRLLVLGLTVIIITGGFLGGGLAYVSIRMFSYEAFTTATGLEATSTSAQLYRDYFLAARQTFIISTVLITTGFILVGALALILVFKRTMQPLETLSDELDNMDVNHLPNAISLQANNPELMKLVATFNTLLQKINVTLESQKHFVANAAHELKTPLSTILTNLDVLELDADPDKTEYEEVFAITKENIERMSNLVKDMLQLTQLQKQDYERFAFSDMTLLNTELRDEIKQKNLTFEIHGDTELEGSKPLLERAIQNLIANAVRYTERGGKIAITLTDETIRIADTGIGIAAADQEKIFEPFYCVDRSRSRELGGSGLGLSIVRQILIRHDMSITLESDIGQGTTFIITL